MRDAFPAGTKECAGCRQILDFGCFPFKYRARGIRQARCRACTSEAARAYYLRRSDSYKARAAANNIRITARTREKLREFLRSAECTDCGLRDFGVLELDHREPQDKRDNVSSMVRQHLSWSTISLEIAKCDVVCASCHRRRTARYFRWRKLLGLEGLVLPALPKRGAPGYERIKSVRRDLVRRHRNRSHVLDFLRRHPCAICGEDDPVVLEFDHLGAKLRDVTVIAARGGWADLIAEIAKCRVLCANCHRRCTAQHAGRLR